MKSTMQRMTSGIAVAVMAAIMGMTSIETAAAAPVVPGHVQLQNDVVKVDHRQRYYDEDGPRWDRRDRWRRHHERRYDRRSDWRDGDGYRERRYGHRHHRRPQIRFYID